MTHKIDIKFRIVRVPGTQKNTLKAATVAIASPVAAFILCIYLVVHKNFISMEYTTKIDIKFRIVWVPGTL